jgi:predicted RNA-binding protein YlxR (DUF448 family)
VVTGEERPADELIRLVLGPDGQLEVDYGRRAGGRGCSVVPTRAAVAAVERNPGIAARVLKAPVAGAAGLLDRVRAANLRATLDLLSLSARSGLAVSGADAVRGAVRAGQAIALIRASDASEQSVADALGGAAVEVFALPLTREALGARVGKGARAMVALRRGAAATALVKELRRGVGLG